MPTSSLRSAAVARENREGGVITVPGPHLTWPTQTVTRRGCDRLDQPGLTAPTSVVERRAGHVRHGGLVVIGEVWRSASVSIASATAIAPRGGEHAPPVAPRDLLDLGGAEPAVTQCVQEPRQSGHVS